ncbi:hypothetical protein VTP01DRAFT_5325 [Rhizomucor pusillus]|uniref:uncharacterized protein n=1 Tax=Rhizomucor pusillus TaxID=4840 RepID=UPI003742A377
MVNILPVIVVVVLVGAVLIVILFAGIAHARSRLQANRRARSNIASRVHLLGHEEQQLSTSARTAAPYDSSSAFEYDQPPPSYEESRHDTRV